MEIKKATIPKFHWVGDFFVSTMMIVYHSLRFVNMFFR